LIYFDISNLSEIMAHNSIIMTFYHNSTIGKHCQHKQHGK